MCPRASCAINVPQHKEETVVTTVKLQMLGMENSYEFWLEQLKIELNFLGSAFLFVKIRLRLSKFVCSQLQRAELNVDYS